MLQYYRICDIFLTVEKTQKTHKKKKKGCLIIYQSWYHTLGITLPLYIIHYSAKAKINLIQEMKKQ